MPKKKLKKAVKAVKPVAKKPRSKKSAPKKKPKKAKAQADPKKHVVKPTPTVLPPIGRGAVVAGTDPCVCGGATEDHGRDPEHPSSTACTHCKDCIAYEADPQEEEEKTVSTIWAPAQGEDPYADADKED